MPAPRLIAMLLAISLLITACSRADADASAWNTATTPATTWASLPVTPGTPGTPGPGATPGSRPGSTASTVPGTTAPGAKPPVVTNGRRTGNKVALTFDADMTDFMKAQLANGKVKSYANLAILDLLERQKIPTTFFLTGQWVEEYPDLTRRITGNPLFEVANHSYEHMGFVPQCYTLPQVSPALMTSDVARTFDVIAPYGGRQTRYFRFPGGCYDQAALQALAPLGLTVVQWDVVSGDPFATAAAPIVRAVLSTVKAGSVVVLHITEDNARFTDDALPEILAGLKAKGLQPATLSEVLAG